MDTLAVIAIATVALECPNAEGNLGASEAKYKTQELEPEIAMRMLDHHVQQNNAQGQVAAHTVGKNMRERQKNRTVDMEMSEARWRDFENQWAHYKRASGVSGQDVVDDLVLCLTDTLRLEVTSELGDGLETVKEKDLLAAYGTQNPDEGPQARGE